MKEHERILKNAILEVDQETRQRRARSYVYCIKHPPCLPHQANWRLVKFLVLAATYGLAVDVDYVIPTEEIPVGWPGRRYPV